ncbi:MAG TPA: hypothetical protein PLE55_01835 [Clostridiales bacterium]|nr:hypothetical protein [Clostridiales bacterium]
MKKVFFLSAIIVLTFVASAFAAPISDYENPASNNEFVQVKNTGASTLGKGAPVVFEGEELVDTTNGREVGVEGSTDTTAVVVGVCTETIEVGAVGKIITYGFGEVLVDEAVAAGANLGLSTTSGEADDNNTNVLSILGQAMEASAGRGLVFSFIKCK